MAVRELALRLGLRAYERAKDLGDRIKVSVERAEESAKDLRKEVSAATRERLQAARLLGGKAKELGKRGDAVAEASRDAALSGRAELGVAGQRLQAVNDLKDRAGNVASLVSGGGIQGVSALVSAGLGGSAAAAIATMVIAVVKEEVDKIVETREKDRQRLILLEVEDRLRSFEERLQQEPIFAQEQAERAAREFDGYQKALAQSGQTDSVEYLEGE